jgi:hypothetical protein
VQRIITILGVRDRRLPTAGRLGGLGFSGFRSRLPMYFEVFLIAFWAVWVTRGYLPLDPVQVPYGREFLSAIQTHHLWTDFVKCGWCSVWNGAERGGVPAFVDPHGSMLHPIVVLTTLLLGVIDGSKFALILSFVFAGLAQWWLAKELGLGRVPRIWSGLMAVVGGHLAGRMELGAFGVVLATAMCSLFFPAALRVYHRGDRHSVVALGVCLASAILAGQGYMQIGLLAAVPSVLVLLVTSDRKLRKEWKSYLGAASIALLLSAPFVVPLAHFLPNFGKGVDPAFGAAQPLGYLPLNLVINDYEFYRDDSLQKLPFPYLNVMFIGWVPVILAVIGLGSAKLGLRRERAFLGIAALIEFLVGSAVLLRLFVRVWPALAGVQNPPQIAGLAVPAILGLSAIGLERLTRLEWPTLSLGSISPDRAISVRLSSSWLLVVPLVFALNEAYQFGHGWLVTDELGGGIATLLAQLQTPSSEWVEPPFGEHFYVEPAIALGLKLSPGIMTWFWKDRPWPLPRLEAVKDGLPEGLVEQIAVADGVPIYLRPSAHYAAVRLDEAIWPCDARSTGGLITVACDAEANGELVVEENNWVGWRAWRDGNPVQLLDGRWLAVEAPAGRHEYVFRYLPWDVPVGIGLSLIGLILCGWMWYRPGSTANVENGDLMDRRSQPSR